MAYKLIDMEVMEELMSEADCDLIAPCGTWDGSDCVENDEWDGDFCVWPAYKELSSREDAGFDFMCEVYEDAETCED